MVSAKASGLTVSRYVVWTKDGRLRSVPAPTPTPDQHLDYDSDRDSSCQNIDDSDSGSDSIHKNILDSGPDSDSKLPENGVNCRHDSDFGVRIAHLWCGLAWIHMTINKYWLSLKKKKRPNFMCITFCILLYLEVDIRIC